MKKRALACVVAMMLGPTVASATTYIPASGNQGFIEYDSTGSELDLGPFNLSAGAVSLNALFTELNTSGSLSFKVFTDPVAPGAAGSLNINLTAEGPPPTGEPTTPGSDNETFGASFGGSPLMFSLVEGDWVAAFQAPFTSISDMIEFKLDFTGFDPGDQFQVNVAQVSAIPLPASLPLFLAALGGFGFLGWRRKTAA